MKSLLVIYDSSIANRGRDSYLRAIKKQIPNVTLVDVRNSVDGIRYNQDYVLVLKPMSGTKLFKISYDIRKLFPEKDIEGVHAGERLALTALAIRDLIMEKYDSPDDIEDKTILIINQSNTVGQPLAKELIDLGANVININSKYEDLEDLLLFTKIDVLVSASGDGNFNIDNYLTYKVDLKIDLSEDLDDGDKITHVPTVQKLKERLLK